MRPLAFIIEKVTDMFMSYTKLYKCQILICVPEWLLLMDKTAKGACWVGLEA